MREVRCGLLDCWLLHKLRFDDRRDGTPRYRVAFIQASRRDVGTAMTRKDTNHEVGSD